MRISAPLPTGPMHSHTGAAMTCIAYDPVLSGLALFLGGLLLGHAIARWRKPRA